MKIKLKASFVGGRVHLVKNCPASEALFDLLGRGPRQTIFPTELPLLVKMGFEPEFSGDLKDLKTDIKNNKIPSFFQEQDDRKSKKNAHK